MKKNQFKLFDNYKINDCKEHYNNLPEYNNIKIPEPKIIATFKFRNEKDFKKFEKVVKEHLYKNERVFDGMQTKTKKQTWFPLNEKSNKYRYE